MTEILMGLPTVLNTLTRQVLSPIFACHVRPWIVYSFLFLLISDPPGKLDEELSTSILLFLDLKSKSQNWCNQKANH